MGSLSALTYYLLLLIITYYYLKCWLSDRCDVVGATPSEEGFIVVL